MDDKLVEKQQHPKQDTFQTPSLCSNTCESIANHNEESRDSKQGQSIISTVDIEMISLSGTPRERSGELISHPIAATNESNDVENVNENHSDLDTTLTINAGKKISAFTRALHQKKNLTEEELENYEQAVSRMIDVALNDHSISTAEALQQVRFAFSNLIQLRDQRNSSQCPTCCAKFSRLIGVKLEIVSDFPGYTTRRISIFLWTFILTLAIILIIVGAFAYSGYFDPPNHCIDCFETTCNDKMFLLGDGSCDDIFNCQEWSFDANDCGTTTGLHNETTEISNITDGSMSLNSNTVMNYWVLAVASLTVGCIVASFQLCCCCCCRFNWQCRQGVSFAVLYFKFIKFAKQMLILIFHQHILKVIAIDSTVCKELGYNCYAMYPKCICNCFKYVWTQHLFIVPWMCM